MQVGAEGADHQLHSLGDRRRAQVAEVKLDEPGDPRALSALPADLEHACRGIDPDHADPLRRDRHRDPPRPDPELYNRPGRDAPRLADIERNVFRDATAPRVVEARDRVVQAHAVMLPGVTATAQKLFTGPRDGTGIPVRPRG